MELKSVNKSKKSFETVSRTELNSWKRGFTPQAEIWNGRMAIVGLFFFLGTLLFLNSIFPK